METDSPLAFFSYCRDDSEFALRLAEDLKAAGANVWMDQLDIEPGTPWDRAVEEAVANSPRMLVILSPVSVKSDNVRDEVSFALSRQKRVIPVLYRQCDVPFRLARLQHIDFTTDYARGLKALMKALGVDQPAQAGATPAPALLDTPTSSVSDADERARAHAREVQEESESKAAEEKAHHREIERQRLAAAQVRLDEERRQAAAAEKARLEQLEREHQTAVEKARQEDERKQANAETTRRELEGREKQAAAEKARQEELDRERVTAEQARAQEAETQAAAERARLERQERERQTAADETRTEELERERIAAEQARLEEEYKTAPSRGRSRRVSRCLLYFAYLAGISVFICRSSSLLERFMGLGILYFWQLSLLPLCVFQWARLSQRSQPSFPDYRPSGAATFRSHGVGQASWPCSCSSSWPSCP